MATELDAESLLAIIQGLDNDFQAVIARHEVTNDLAAAYNVQRCEYLRQVQISLDRQVALAIRFGCALPDRVRTVRRNYDNCRPQAINNGTQSNNRRFESLSATQHGTQVQSARAPVSRDSAMPTLKAMEASAPAIPLPMAATRPEPQIPATETEPTAKRLKLTESQESENSCTACSAPVDPTQTSQCLRAPCGHYYCSGCLQSLFLIVCVDIELFPPRCCRLPFNISATAGLDSLLGSELWATFQTKALEFSTKNPTYCSNHACSAFVPSTDIKDGTAECSKCGTATCVQCKNNKHDGPCEDDTSAKEMEDYAKKQGWQTCDCGRIIELTTGCYHITCKCGAHFCYLCKGKWKSCLCPVWDEARLVAVTQARAAQQARAGENAAQAARRAQAIRTRFRQQEECEHREYFTRCISGRLFCELCHHTLPEFILECPNCYMRICRDCKRNRLR